MPAVLHLLALAVFAMGTSEFMLAGLVPDIAVSMGVTVGAAGLLTSAFAVGMVIGAPLMAVSARHWPARASLLAAVIVFAAAHIVSALTHDFSVLLGARMIAALANAGFLAVALSTAVLLVRTDEKGRALAVLLGGTTVATVAGVPAGAFVGETVGWRATFWAVAVLCLVAAAGIVMGLPARPAARPAAAEPSLRTELAQLRSPTLLTAMLRGALVNGGTFAAFTFLAPVVTDVAGLGNAWVVVALVLFGAGSFAGVTVAGRLSDSRPGVVIGVGGPLLVLGWIALALVAAHAVVLLVLVFVQGALSFAVGSTLITRVLYSATDAPSMGGSYATAALNVGAACGPALAAISLGGSAGALGPVWVAAGLTASAVLASMPLRRARVSW